MRAEEITWAGGEHRFLLNIELLRALQQRCDAGPEHVLNRLRAGTWMVDDIVSTIRLGLEGGAMSKEEARFLVEKHVESRPLAMSKITAMLVLSMALYGTEDDPVGEAPAGAEVTPTLSREESGGSAGSTPSAP